MYLWRAVEQDVEGLSYAAMGARSGHLPGVAEISFTVTPPPAPPRMTQPSRFVDGGLIAGCDGHHTTRAVHGSRFLDRALPLNKAAEAHRLIADSEVKGNIVLLPWAD